MESRLNWKDQYALGVEEIDKDHQRLVEIVDRVVAAAEAGTNLTDVRDHLDDLIEEAVKHFEHEERNMEAVHYPRLAEHREAHNQLIRTFIKFKSEFRLKRLAVREVAYLIIDWLVEHIKSLDLEYAKYLLTRGIK